MYYLDISWPSVNLGLFLSAHIPAEAVAIREPTCYKSGPWCPYQIVPSAHVLPFPILLDRDMDSCFPGPQHQDVSEKAFALRL